MESSERDSNDGVGVARSADQDDRVQCLLEVSRHLVATFDLEVILQAATDAVTKLAGLDTAAVYLIEGDMLRMWATTPPLPPDFPEALRLAPASEHPHIRAAIEAKAPLTLPDMPAIELTAAEQAAADNRNLRTVIFIPLVAGGRSMGSLIVGSVGEQKAVATADVDLCYTLANLVALAVENARLFHTSQMNVGELKQTLAARERAERERLALERKLLHAQRLDSLGLLAGGIAHDFNNLLMAIQANLELAMRKLPREAPAYPDIEHCFRATRRAADLAGQMLAYSGRGRFEVAPVDLNALVRENSELFRSSVARSITIDLALADSLPPIEGDAGQLQQIAMNLITNAAEAIGDRGGTIAIRTGEEDRDDEQLSRSLTPEVSSAERFTVLEVADNGCGMDDATQARLFDPFFSTKGTGRGLGMAAILGIVRAHHGAIFVDSTPGVGTTIRVLLPTLPQPGARPARQAVDVRADQAPALSGAVLLADDEESVLSVCQRMLEAEGLRVLTASDGRQAVDVFREHADQIRCVILDQTMPNMDGVSAFKEIVEIKPDARVLLVSGYSERDVVRTAGPGLAGFLQKPYTLDQLLDALGKCLTDGA